MINSCSVDERRVPEFVVEAELAEELLDLEDFVVDLSFAGRPVAGLALEDELIRQEAIAYYIEVLPAFNRRAMWDLVCFLR